MKRITKTISGGINSNEKLHITYLVVINITGYLFLRLISNENMFYYYLY